MKNYKFFISENSEFSGLINSVLSQLIKLGYKYSIGGTSKNCDNPFYICLYDNGTIELINRNLSEEEMSMLISSKDDFSKVFDFIDMLSSSGLKQKNINRSVRMFFEDLLDSFRNSAR